MSEKKYFEHKHIDFKYTKGKVDIYKNMFHDYYEIYLLINGDVEMINTKSKRTVAPYQLFIIPPGEYHQFTVSGNIENYERYVLNIHGGFLEESVLNHAFYKKELLTLSASHRIVKNFLYLRDCLTILNKPDFSHILSAVATDIIFLIKYNTDNSAIENTQQFSFELIQFLDEHYAKPLDLIQLSHEFHCSVSSLCHIFKKSFGISIKKYITQKRMNASKLDIQNGGKPEEVCFKYGFSDYSTFYRAYKNQFGISPSQTIARNQSK